MHRNIGEQDLIQYADGELPPDVAATVEHYLRTRPQERARVDALIQLREQSRRQVRQTTADVPETLRLAIHRIADDWVDDAKLGKAATDRTGMRVGTAPVSARIGFAFWRKSPVGLAAAVALIGMVGVGLVWKLTSTDKSRDARSIDTINVSMSNAIVAKHRMCSRLADHFYDPMFPRVLSEVPATARELLQDTATFPDLTGLGYRFDGAGRCSIPRFTTLHVQYERIANPQQHISIFVMPFSDQVTCAVGSIMLMPGGDPKYPIVAWRTEKLAYFLVGDDPAEAKRTVEAMGYKWQW